MTVQRTRRHVQMKYCMICPDAGRIGTRESTPEQVEVMPFSACRIKCLARNVAAPIASDLPASPRHRPAILVVSQLLHVVVLIPAVYIAASYSFMALYWTRSLIRLEGMAVNMFFAWYLIRQSPWRMITNVLPEIVGCLSMSVVATLLLSINRSIVCSLLWIIPSAIVYFATISLFSKEKQLLTQLYTHFSQKLHCKHI